MAGFMYLEDESNIKNQKFKIYFELLNVLKILSEKKTGTIISEEAVFKNLYFNY
jgi:hypothetical protein